MLENDKNSLTNAKLDPAETCEVFVLKNTIREGNEIFPEDVLVVRQYKDAVPRGAVKTYQQIEGRSVKTQLLQGTVLRDEFFVARLANGNAKGFIPPGYHSVPVLIHEPVTDRLKNHSVVQPGDQVDVIIVKTDKETGEESSDYLLLEKIPVLDILWSDIDNSRQIENKGTVNLLLSDSQRKNLLDEFQEGTKIRLRICPQSEPQTFAGLQPQDLLDMAGSQDFYQTDYQPELISQRLQNNNSEGEIEIIFRDNSQFSEDVQSPHALKPVSPSELQLPVLRGIPSDSYAAKTQTVTQVSAVEKSKPFVDPVENRPIPRYLSYYDPSGQKRNGNTQWQTVVPHSPLVYEAKPGSHTQVRGVYREGKAYYTAE